MLATHEALETRLDQLTTLLTDRRPLWEPRPFVHLPADWEADHPEIAAWLRGRTADEADALDVADEAVWRTASPPLRTLALEAEELCRVPELSRDDGDLPRTLSRRVPGRKWRQLRAFAAAASPALACDELTIVDWCSGKGHLGRTLANVAGVGAVCLERQPGLCSTGRQLAHEAGASVRFVETDVHDPSAWRELDFRSVAVGLHACGALSDRLVREATARGVHALLSVPCCHHHLAGRKHHEPLSWAGARARLPLSYGALRLATLGETAARPAARRRRRREQAWRLGMDLLLREASGRDEYTPLGALPAAIVNAPFESFCRQTAARLDLDLPAVWSAPAAQRAGEERGRQVLALGIVRGLYRRPLELWLVLDRALHVAEAGRPVEVGSFCSHELTPRNLMIRSVSNPRKT